MCADSAQPDLTGANCIECGYDLTGLTSSSCPECGWPISAHEVDSQRRQRAFRARPLLLLPGLVGMVVVTVLAIGTVALARRFFPGSAGSWPMIRIELMVVAVTTCGGLPGAWLARPRRLWPIHARLWLDHAVWLHVPVAAALLACALAWALLVLLPSLGSALVMAMALCWIIAWIGCMFHWIMRYSGGAERLGLVATVPMPVGACGAAIGVLNLAWGYGIVLLSRDVLL